MYTDALSGRGAMNPKAQATHTSPQRLSGRDLLPRIRPVLRPPSPRPHRCTAALTLVTAAQSPGHWYVKASFACTESSSARSRSRTSGTFSEPPETPDHASPRYSSPARRGQAAVREGRDLSDPHEPRRRAPEVLDAQRQDTTSQFESSSGHARYPLARVG